MWYIAPFKAKWKATHRLFSDDAFVGLRNALNSKMKLLRRSGSGLSNRSDIITYEEENLLWEKGLLGEHSPDTLRDTIVFMCGTYFALRGGSELRSLRTQQITINKSTSGESYLIVPGDRL